VRPPTSLPGFEGVVATQDPSRRPLRGHDDDDPGKPGTSGTTRTGCPGTGSASKANLREDRRISQVQLVGQSPGNSSCHNYRHPRALRGIVDPGMRAAYEICCPNCGNTERLSAQLRGLAPAVSRRGKPAANV